jgi:GNAT superfamily N-acetyltransferase
VSLVVRPACIGDLVSAENLVARSINDLAIRHGFGPIASSRAPDFQSFCLRDDPRGVWLAEESGEIAGFALSWVCDRLWFLAELFVSPDHQGKNIGNELLERTLQHAGQAGATQRSLITFAFNVVSQGLYVRHGLLPRVPIHLCSVRRDSLSRVRKKSELRTATISAREDDLRKLRRIDLASLGISREKHHRYLLSEPSITGLLLEDNRGECVGYAYVSAGGHVGPLAVEDVHAMPAAFRTALAHAAACRSEQISAFVPGPSDALEVATALGMRLTLPMVMMSSTESGDWKRYMPRNPGLM